MNQKELFEIKKIRTFQEPIMMRMGIPLTTFLENNSTSIKDEGIGGIFHILKEKIEKKNIDCNYNYTPYVPHNFAIAEKNIYVSGIPTIKNHIKTLIDFFNIKLIVTCCNFPLKSGRIVDFTIMDDDKDKEKEKEVAFVMMDLDEKLIDESDRKQMKFLHCPIIDGQVPSIEQKDILFKRIQEKNIGDDEGILFHCISGVGRSWSMCFKYLNEIKGHEKKFLWENRRGKMTKMTEMQENFFFKDKYEDLETIISKFSFVYSKLDFLYEFYWKKMIQFTISNEQKQYILKFGDQKTSEVDLNLIFNYIILRMCGLKDFNLFEKYCFTMKEEIKDIKVLKKMEKKDEFEDEFLEYFVEKLKNFVINLEDVSFQVKILKWILKHKKDDKEFKAKLKELKSKTDTFLKSFDDKITEISKIEEEKEIISKIKEMRKIFSLISKLNKNKKKITLENYDPLVKDLLKREDLNVLRYLISKEIVSRKRIFNISSQVKKKMFFVKNFKALKKN